MKIQMLTISLCLISLMNFAQINLEHTFSGLDLVSPINTNDQTMYYNYNTTTNVLTLYANDYSLYKSITIAPPAGFKTPTLIGGSISTKIFNTDNLVEFCFSFITTSTSNPYEYKLLLYNENLQVIKDFGNRMSLFIFKTVDNQTKCSVTGYTVSGSQITYYQDIYHLPGNLPVDVFNELLSTIEQTPFPNPTNTFIIIPFSLEEKETTMLDIFNQNGQIIYSKKINRDEKSIKYDVSGLNPGLYFYQYNNVREKFIVTK